MKFIDFDLVQIVKNADTFPETATSLIEAANSLIGKKAVIFVNHDKNSKNKYPYYAVVSVGENNTYDAKFLFKPSELKLIERPKITFHKNRSVTYAKNPKFNNVLFVL